MRWHENPRTALALAAVAAVLAVVSLVGNRVWPEPWGHAEPEVSPKHRPEVVCVRESSEAGMSQRCWRVTP